MKYIVLGIVISLISILGFTEMTTEDKFSIFQPKENITQDEIWNIDIKKILLKKTPILSESDLIVYNRVSHSIKLSASSSERVMSLEDGTIVIVCLGRKPIYWGIIWSSIYSVALNGVFIMKPSPWDKDKCTFQIRCGYPSEEMYTGKDPRDNSEILESLRKAGKLCE